MRYICVLASILAGVATACADGMMTPRIERLGTAGKTVSSPKQEAVLTTDGRTVQVILRTHFRAGPSELAWIVPVPARPTKVDTAGENVFDILQRNTAPQFFMVNRPSGWKHLGCGCDASMDAGQVDVRRVIVEETGTAGIFEYAILSATGAGELTDWLNGNKYHVPAGFERICRSYVQAGWHWLAMKVRPELSESPTLAPHPIRYTYKDTKLVYPLVISQMSADLKNEIVLYVVARSRYACANWTNTTIDELTGEGNKLVVDPDSPSGTNYEALFNTEAERHQGHLFVAEYAKNRRLFGYADGRSGEIDGAIGRGLIDAMGAEQTVTRLRAVMPAGAMDRDVVLVPVAGWKAVDNVFEISAADRRAATLASLGAPAAAFVILCLGTGFLKRSDGSRLKRLAAVACIAAACTAFAMM